MPELIDPATRAAQLARTAAQHSEMHTSYNDSNHRQRLEMLAEAQVWATLALRPTEEPEVKAAAWTSATPAVRVGELVCRNAHTNDRISLRFAAQNRMAILLMKHGGLAVSETFITEPRAARIAGEVLQGKFGDIDTDTLDELSFHLGVLTEAQRLSALDNL
ncbi:MULTISPECIES: hypothetical protein [unclassified Rhodococcus (in: high G+C Gram-positive bacteria)]|uniref:hypothetical protein n=1 Tax=unclassified Rhodococcus (in: high G+C Gram-positive bacteria) TaxID=192944 RepID=UPI001179C5F1|nr:MULTISPECIES: hypothetical protein [unclassified Rhodococcus (in: high G+C Gram-positive bacteria)]